VRPQTAECGPDILFFADFSPLRFSEVWKTVTAGQSTSTLVKQSRPVQYLQKLCSSVNWRGQLAANKSLLVGGALRGDAPARTKTFLQQQLTRNTTTPGRRNLALLLPGRPIVWLLFERQRPPKRRAASGWSRFRLSCRAGILTRRRTAQDLAGGWLPCSLRLARTWGAVSLCGFTAGIGLCQQLNYGPHHHSRTPALQDRRKLHMSIHRIWGTTIRRFRGTNQLIPSRLGP